MTVYGDKLRRLSETVELQAEQEVDRLARALRDSCGRLVFAVGSGGSAIAAEFLARCRTTLGHGHTIVQTPMELVQAVGDLDGCEVWLLSAGADNPDVAAALQAALRMRPAAIRLVTVKEEGATAVRAAADPRCDVIVLPVADPKDGFLATHSLTATVAALALACVAPTGPVDFGARRAELRDGLKHALRLEEGASGALRGFAPGDTLVILHDPQIRAVAVLIETSAWETGLCPVQRTDFRNFAHGRHVWLAKRPGSTYLMALTTAESRPVWSALDALVPPAVRRTAIDLDAGGRRAVALGVFRGLALVGELGDAVGIDPGRPGVGEFARPIYEDAALTRLSDDLTPAVRHKREAVFSRDPPPGGGAALAKVGLDRLRALGETVFGGIVLDYDGTVVETGDRFSPPARAILDELVRLIGGGLRVGIATGRGGSAGEMLRSQIPSHAQAGLLMGYYNGAFIRPLDVDIAANPPDQNGDVVEAADWLDEHVLLAEGRRPKVGRLQLEVNRADVVDAAGFAAAARRCPPVAAGRMRVVQSQHSFDFVSRDASKLAVVRAIAAAAGGRDVPVLRIGDSGAEEGNDHELLSGPYGISVGTVCGSMKTWSVFGRAVRGPAALLKILAALKVGPDGARLQIGALSLEG